MGHFVHSLIAALAAVACCSIACGSGPTRPARTAAKRAAPDASPAVAVGADGTPVALPVGASLAHLDDGVPYVFATGSSPSSGSELGDLPDLDTELVAIGPGGTAVVRRGYDAIALVNLATGKEGWRKNVDSLDTVELTANGGVFVRDYDEQFIFDTKTGSSKKVGGQARESAVSDDAALIAIADDAGLITVYETKSLGKKAELAGARHTPEALAFSPDGKRLLSVDSRAIRVWSLASQRTIYLAPRDRVTAVAWADNDTLVTGDWDGRIATGEVDAAPRPRPFDALLEVPGRVVSIARVTGTSRVVANLEGTFASVVDLVTKKEVARLQKNEGAPVLVSRDGASAAVGGMHRTVYDLATLKPRAGRAGHVGAVDALSERGGKLASGGRDGAVIVWDVATKRPIARRMGLDPVAGIDIGPKGEIAVATRKGDVLVFDATLQSRSLRLYLGEEREHDRPSVTFSPDGKQLVASGGDRAVLYDLEKGEIIAAYTETFSHVRFGPDFFVGGPGPVSVVRRRDGAVLRSDAQWYSGGFALGLVEGKYAVLASSAEYSSVIAAVGAPARTERRESGAYSLGEPLAFSPDGRVLASVASDVELLDTATGEKLATKAVLKAPGTERTPGASSVRFAADGKTVFVGYDEGVIQSLAAPSARPLRNIVAPGFDRTKSFPLADLSGAALAIGPREVGMDARLEASRTRALPGNAVALGTGGSVVAVSLAGRLAIHDLATGKTVDDVYFSGRIERAAVRSFVGKDSYSDPVQILGLGKPLEASKDCNHVLPVSDDTYLCADYRAVRLLGKKRVTSKAKLDYTRGVAVDDRGTRIAVATQSDVVVLDGDTLSLLARIDVHSAGALSVSGDGKRLAIASMGTALVVDAASGRVLRLFEGHPVERVLLSRDGSKLATVGHDLARVWDTETGKVRAVFEIGQVEDEWAFSPDGKSLLVARGKELGIWDVP